MPAASRLAGSPRGRDLRRAIRRHRSWLTAALVAAAVAAGLTAVSPPAAPRAAIVVAARDLPAGAVVGAADLTIERVPAAAVPDGALRSARDAAGHRVAGPVRRGEPITDVRLVGPGLLAGLPRPTGNGDEPGGSGGWVAVPVRLTDAGAAAVVAPGDRIDVIATPADGAGPATVVAPGVLVVATLASAGYPTGVTGPAGFGGGAAAGLGGGGTPGAGAGAGAVAADPGDGGLVVVATTPAVAAGLARAAVGEQLSPAVLPQDEGR